MNLNYYEILQVQPAATQRDIKLAYRKLVQLYHPDVSIAADSDDKIKRINMAYETLSKPSKRSIYDQSLLRNFTSNTPDFYTPPPSQPTSRKPPPSYYQKAAEEAEPTYTLKLKIIGWSATVLAIVLIGTANIAMHYYASEYYFKKGLEAEQLNNLSAALNFYKEAIRDFGSKSVEASIRCAEISDSYKSYQFMSNFAQEGLTYHPDSIQMARLLYLQGKGFANTNKYIEAENAFLESQKYLYNKDSLFRQLGLLYVNHLANYQKGIEYYSYLLSNNSINFADYYNRGICFQYLGKHYKAIEDFQEVVSVYPTHTQSLFQLGRSYLALGQNTLACYYLNLSQEQGVSIDPADFAKACE